MNEQAGGHVDVAEVLRDLSGLIHAAADERDLAAVLVGHFHRELDAMDGRGKAGDEEALLGRAEDVFKARADSTLARRVPGALDVGGILKEREDAALAVVGEGVQVEEAIVRGRGIDFEISGMDDDAYRRFDGECNAIDERVRDLDRLDGEGADGEFLAGTDLAEVGVVEEFVLVELVLDVGECEVGAIDGHVEFAQNPRYGADVVFVAVGEDDGADVRAILDEIGEVGDDDVHAEELGFGEHEAGVDDDDVVSPADGHAVHAELAAAPERYDL